MDLIQLLKNEYISIIAGGLGGITATWLSHRMLNKRGLFTYFVNHNRIGISTEDEIFGSVAVSWNNNPIQNLYLSTIEMKNESMNDYENIIVKAYTNDTKLMTEQTQLLDTPNTLEWSEQYKNQIHVNSDQTPTDVQWKLYNSQREYKVPILNRGQSIKITYLNSANDSSIPSIWLSVMQKGVKLKFQPPQNEILGVPQPRAAFSGVVIGILVLIALATFVTEPWIIAIAAMIYGLIAQFPGAYLIKLLRRVREAIGN